MKFALPITTALAVMWITPQPAAAVFDGKVTALDLYNPDTNERLGDLSVLSAFCPSESGFNVKALVDGPVAKVKFEIWDDNWDTIYTKTEENAPYFLYGNQGDIVFGPSSAEELDLDSRFFLGATPYSEDGTAGETFYAIMGLKLYNVDDEDTQWMSDFPNDVVPCTSDGLSGIRLLKSTLKRLPVRGSIAYNFIFFIEILTAFFSM
jgi:hypothetical protein